MPKARRKVTTPVFRVCFPSVFNLARPMEGATTEPKYEVTCVFPDPKTITEPKEKQRLMDMKALADECSMEMFKKPCSQLPPNFIKPFRSNAEKEHLDGFPAGGIFTKISSKVKPGIVGADGKTQLTDAAAFYPGCYARATVTAYAFKNKSSGVKFGLQNLMFVADGERLDGKRDASEDFGEDGVDAPAGADDDFI